jgi:hypothetical protein
MDGCVDRKIYIYIYAFLEYNNILAVINVKITKKCFFKLKNPNNIQIDTTDMFL